MRICTTCLKPITSSWWECLACMSFIDKEQAVADFINKPPHYNQWNIEVLDFILDQKMDYLQWNCLKYLARFKHKGWVQDLKKCKYYLDKLIEDYD